MTAVPSVPSHPEEPNDLEELEQFARTFKQRRIKLGFTQVWQTHWLHLRKCPSPLDVYN